MVAVIGFKHLLFHHHPHQPPPVHRPAPAPGPLPLGKRLHPVGLDPRADHGEGDGLGGVGPYRDGGGVVGQDGDAPVEARPLKARQDRSDDPGVEALDRLDLLFELAIVAHLVGGLDVEVDEVHPVEGLEAGGDLPLVVGVEDSGGSGDVDYLEAGVDPHPL